MVESRRAALLRHGRAYQARWDGWLPCQQRTMGKHKSLLGTPIRRGILGSQGRLMEWKHIDARRMGGGSLRRSISKSSWQVGPAGSDRHRSWRGNAPSPATHLAVAALEC